MDMPGDINGSVSSFPWTVVVTSMGMGMSSGHDHAGHDHGTQSSWSCDGSPWTPFKVGTWSVHVLCGVMLLAWGLHWALATFTTYASATAQSPFRSRPTYALPFCPPSWPVEAAAKVALPLLAILAELWWSNSGNWRSQLCAMEQGATHARDAHFDVQNIYAWQNSVVLFTFLLSGVIDLLALRVELPPHTQEFFLGLAFLFEGFGLRSNVFSDGFEEMLYYLVYLVAMSASLVIFLQAAYPEDFFLSAARSYFVLVQGVWMIAIARFQYEGRPAWDTQKPFMDMAPEMIVPVVFVMWLNIISFSLFLVFLCVRGWHARFGTAAHASGLSSGGGAAGDTHENGWGSRHTNGGGLPRSSGRGVLEMKPLSATRI